MLRFRPAPDLAFLAGQPLGLQQEGQVVRPRPPQRQHAGYGRSWAQSAGTSAKLCATASEPAAISGAP